jgi:hypothetical protein
MKIEIETPETYLSKTLEGWTVINNGMPICAMTSREGATLCAERFKLELPNVFWDGENGTFEIE